MNDNELKKIMIEIDLIINQLAECSFCKQGMDLKSRKVLSELFELKIRQACQLKQAEVKKAS
ncbi:MAG: hypothetical protein R3E90_08950 [Marinicella sp.]|nr:hypothetical protein [Xanthomonadales bacterium]